ncbi:MAG TPA: hypothetical protein VGF48_14035 [Thermoanaerobaculia bacterium]|jgi:hypothetical protein
MRERAVVGLALTAALARLIPLQWLHPLQWDEIEFFRATNWVRQGLVPYRDFWEHHTPLQWFLFAPVTALTSSPGAAAIILMRWAQLPLWIAAFWFAMRLMQRAELPPFARWSALAAVLASSMFMGPAIEYRIDTVGCALYLAALFLHRRPLLAGALLCLAGLANLRLGPLLAATAILLAVIDLEEQRWRLQIRRALLIGAGVFIPLFLAAIYFIVTDSWRDLYRHVWFENYLGDRFATDIRAGFTHRVMLPFGLQILGSQRGFSLTGVDPGGIAILIGGAFGLVLALRHARRPNLLFTIALLQLVNVAFIAKMKFVFHYHLEIVVMLMLPLLAFGLSRIARREVVIAIVAAAWCVNLFASVFRGKELDRAYQDLIMREVHARTAPGDKVFDGIGWALRREPAYRFWFLPDLTRQLVARGYATSYAAHELPAAVIADFNALTWLRNDRELQQRLVRHYLPVWRNLWMPGLNARLAPGATFSWTAPIDGAYRLYATPALARHPWFSRPLFVATYHEEDAVRMSLVLDQTIEHPALTWSVAPRNGVIHLKKGQSLDVTSRAGEEIGVMLVPGHDRIVFRQPPPRVTLDASTPRTTHIPFR